MNQKACIFCDSPLSKAGKANEDVIPKWLLKHLGLDKSKDLIASSHLTDLGIALKRPRIQGSYHSSKLRALVKSRVWRQGRFGVLQ